MGQRSICQCIFFFARVPLPASSARFPPFHRLPIKHCPRRASLSPRFSVSAFVTTHDVHDVIRPVVAPSTFTGVASRVARLAPATNSFSVIGKMLFLCAARQVFLSCLTCSDFLYVLAPHATSTPTGPPSRDRSSGPNTLKGPRGLSCNAFAQLKLSDCCLGASFVVFCFSFFGL